ncbi:MAG: TIM barrel protein [Bacteroidota bacterium]
MKRRTFFKKGALGTALLATQNGLAMSTPLSDAKAAFHLKYAPHLGMFKAHAGEDPIAQLEFMAAEGFRAFEDNEMRNRDLALQKKMAAAMSRLGLEMGVFVGHKIYWQKANLAGGNADDRAEFLNDIRQSIEVAKRVNARWMTVVPGHLDLKLDIGYQTANVIETLKRASALLDPHGLCMVLEPLNFRDHPGLFLTKSAQAFQICKAVDSPACKILFDIYHQQIQEGNLLPNIEQCWEEIAYFQVGDNPGRNEPTTGEINYHNIFKYLHHRQFDGIIGMEHGNAAPEKAGERALIDAYRTVDRF